MLRRHPHFAASTTEHSTVLQKAWISIPDPYFAKLVPYIPTGLILVNLHGEKSKKY